MSSVLWSLLPSGLIVVALVLIPPARAAVGRWLAGMVQHHFDQRLEELKSDLNRQEDAFRAQLQVNERLLEWTAERAISLRSNRQAVLHARRLEAVDNLWRAKVEVDQLRPLASMISRLDLQKVIRASKEKDPEVNRVLSAIKAVAPPFGALDKSAALYERPHLNEEVWKLFYAYDGFLRYTYVFLEYTLCDAAHLVKENPAFMQTFIELFPELEWYINKYGIAGCYQLLDTVERKLIHSIGEMLDGDKLDEIAIKRSAEMISNAQSFNKNPSIAIPEGLQHEEVPDPVAAARHN